ncbi:hypothetical protein BXP70_17750 [Hymenobacter crusticola]|uniref:Acyltransferase 3 domain-containing protein n=2 Tax=Hymenobacter crusticola TaxID=1770526 RepID=A0A243WD74_9BACT|nr:hypothetical protein BXP70_17750 [Hymenobacter crusticola]
MATKALYPVGVAHANNFDFIRVLLATAVVFCHSYGVYDGTIERDPLWRWSGHQLSVGTAAINFFFAISGFLVSQSWTREPHYLRFLQKRVLRIYPGFVAVCLLEALLFGPLGRGWPPAFRAYWSEVGIRGFLFRTATLREPILPPTLLQLPIPNFLNASLWSISYEFVCYQLIALAAVLGAWTKPARILWLFLGLLVLNIGHYPVYQLYNVAGTLDPHLLPYYPALYAERLLTLEHLLLPFTAGMCCYAYRHHLPRSRWGLLLSLLALAGTLRTGVGFEIAQAVFGVYVLLYVSLQQRVTFPRFAQFGDFSYGIYLYGWPLLQLVLLYAQGHLTVGGVFGCTMALVVPVAALSWHLVEKPFLRFKSFPVLPLRS